MAVIQIQPITLVRVVDQSGKVRFSITDMLYTEITIGSTWEYGGLNYHVVELFIIQNTLNIIVK